MVMFDTSIKLAYIILSILLQTITKYLFSYIVLLYFTSTYYKL